MVFLNITFLRQTKKSIIFDFWSSTTSAGTKFLLQKSSNHWMTECYQGSSDRGEGDLDSDLKFLASGNLWKYTTIPSQCEQLPWTWMWRILYLDCWSHLIIFLVVFSLLRASNFHYNKWHVIVDNITILTIHRGLLCIIFLQSLSIWW